MSFEEVQFPKSISYGSSGGPGFLTQINTISSGFEKRNLRWPYPRHKYNVAYGVKTASQLEELINFFNAMNGRAIGFRYNDPLDHKTCSYKNQPSAFDVTNITSAVGGETTFQLVKKYQVGSRIITRPIKKPIQGTVKVAVNGNELTPAYFTVDHTQGLVTLNVPLTAGDSVTSGCEFDVPCRFDTDTLQINLVADIVGNTEIPVVEIKV